MEDFAVITAVPAAFAVTFPFTSTVATLELLDAYVTSVQLSPLTLSCCVAPIYNVPEVLLSAMVPYTICAETSA